MKFLKKLLFLLIGTTTLVYSGNTNLSLNYSDSFKYARLESTQFYDWGSFYGFMDVGNDGLFILKPTFDIKLAGNLNFHTHDFYLKDKDFYVNNLIVGSSYNIIDGNLFLQPFIGLNYQKDTYFDGYNGLMAGWVFNYKFQLNDQKFSLEQWNEYSFKRVSEEKNGNQGAISFWWHLSKTFTTGVQYRYFNNDSGFKGYYSEMIYSVKYNF